MRNQYSFFVIVLLTSSLYAAQRFKLGLENIPVDLKQKLQHKVVALITDRSASDQQGISSLSCLLKEGIPVSKLFSTDDILCLDPSRSVSLYDASKLEEECTSLDVFLVDLTDFGLRHAPSLALLAQTLSLASQYHKEIVILDRPNPLGCRMEGPLSEQSQQYRPVLPIPFRHGMTLGELAWFCNMHYLTRPAQLRVVCMKGYSRNNVQLANQSDIQSLFGLLAEINPFSLRGASLFISGQEFSELWQTFARSLQFGGIRAMCSTDSEGLKLAIEVPDSNRVPSFKTMLYMLDFFKEHAIELALSDRFDALVGTQTMRRYLESTCSFEEFSSAVNDDLASFYRKARSSFMYTPLPEVCELTQVRS